LLLTYAHFCLLCSFTLVYAPVCSVTLLDSYWCYITTLYTHILLQNSKFFFRRQVRREREKKRPPQGVSKNWISDGNQGFYSFPHVNIAARHSRQMKITYFHKISSVSVCVCVSACVRVCAFCVCVCVCVLCLFMYVTFAHLQGKNASVFALLAAVRDFFQGV